MLEDLGLGDADVDAIYTERVRGHLRKLGHESAVREIGRQVAADKGHTPVPLDETLEQVRRSVRQFVEVEVAPQAEHIHRHDELIPESFIAKMGEVGYFGLSVPERYGGFEMGNLAMILTTERAVAGFSRGSRLAHHASGDPREGAPRRRYRGAEERVAPEDRVR